jgi:hypothetical protein
MSLIESEIVIIDDDGTGEPFDPASWFECTERPPTRMVNL